MFNRSGAYITVDKEPLRALGNMLLHEKHLEEEQSNCSVCFSFPAFLNTSISNYFTQLTRGLNS